MPDFRDDIRRFLAPFALAPTRESEIAEELSQHLSDRFDEMVASGASEAEARRAVAAEFDSPGFAAQWRAVIERARPPVVLGDDSGTRWFNGLLKDFRFALRQLRLSPGFAAVAILSLALGIGANTAIFQLLDALRLRTLPVRDPQQLANLEIVAAPGPLSGHFNGIFANLTTAQWQQFRTRQQAFSSLAAWSATRLNLNPSGQARYAHSVYVSGDFFATLGVGAAAGRLLTPADDQRGCGPGAAVISYAFWQREFAGQSSAVGKTLKLEGLPFQVVGVTAPGFFGPEVGRSFDVAVPLCAEPLIAREFSMYNDPVGWWLAAVGRLKPGWTMQRASAHFAALSPSVLQATLPAQFGPDTRKGYLDLLFGATPAATGVSQLRDQYVSPLWMLLGIAATVLLIACANLATLMLARASGRRREMAIRLALGASRVRILRQLLAESFLLALSGTIVGAALARALSRTLVSALSTQDTSLYLDLGLDWRILGFTAALAVFTCVLFGLVPAWQASRTAPGEAMKAGSRTANTGPRGFALRRALVVSQVALSLLLVVAAALFVRTFTNLAGLDPGFREDHLLVAGLDYSQLALPKERRVSYKLGLLEKVRAIPGVTSVAAANVVPLTGMSWNDVVQIDGSTEKYVPWFNRVTPGFFRTMDTPLIAGRDFRESDDASAPRVAVVNQAFARKFLGGANPVGLTFKLLQGQEQPVPYQVVGLVADTKYVDLREDFRPLVYVAEAQSLQPDMSAQLLVRSGMSFESLTAAIKRTVAQESPEAVLDFHVYRTMVRDGLARERLMATLAGFFGALAVLLAMIGLYGVISYMVVRRRNEIGIRMALGATPARILRMVVREAGVLLAIGVAIGVVLSLVAAPAARALLFGLKPTDPLTLTLAACGLAVVAVAASVFPARRAAALDPMLALRDE